jgi:WS/DGAT/MGAT family acyltransferase
MNRARHATAVRSTSHAPVLQALELPRRMAATDALFWYAESALPIFRPIIAGLYVLDRPPDPVRMEHGLELALALVPRLRQRVREAPWHLGMPEWRDDPHFDASYHVRHISLPPPGSVRELLDLAATLFATPLDRERPLWEAYWIDGLAGRRAAYLFKVHHSVVDGVGSLTLLEGLTQPARTSPMPHVARHTSHLDGQPEPSLARLATLAADNTVASVRAASAAARVPIRFLVHPVEAAAEVARTVRGVRATLIDLFAAPITDPLAAACPGLSRRFDVMEIPLTRLRRIKEPLGVTINDVILAVLAGALGAYHRQRHIHVETLNCMVPMNLRASSERNALGNRVGTFTVRLPLGARHARERLDLITSQTRAAKSDRRGAVAPVVLQAVSLLPGTALRWIARQSLGKVNIACTNVPGLRERRYMAGARVEAIYPFASVVEGTPLVVALLSYADGMFVGIDTDPEAIPDPQRVHALFDAGLSEMERLAGIAPARTRIARVH